MHALSTSKFVEPAAARAHSTARGVPAMLALSGVLAMFGACAAQPTTAPSEHGELRITELASGLSHPWGMVFLPDDAGMLITEKPGRLRRLAPDGKLSAPLQGVPPVYSESQGGLLDVTLSPDFPSDRLVYLAYAKSDGGKGASTAVGRGKLSPDHTRIDDFTEIFLQQPALSRGQHFGARLVFDREGFLFITLGDNNQRPTAQDLDKLQGKVIRVQADGSVPPDNPFVGRKQARPEIWSYGHRNQQGAALHPVTGALWTHEHGPRGGDEINIPAAGMNYGWPLATHGGNYNMLPIPEAKGSAAPGTEPPHHVWKESPAISGMAFYTSERFPPWQGDLFIGALKTRELIRLELDGDAITHEERLLGELGERIRDVRQGPDGNLYLLTDAAQGKLLKVEPPAGGT